MKAIIMAGGEGTRLKSVTGDVPKPMVRLAGKPVLEHILDLLRRSGITDVCMSLRYHPEIITAHFGSGERFGMKIRYHIEEEPLGTAGGVKACLDPLDTRDFLVISGDCVCDFNLSALMEAHRRHGSAVTIALHPEPSPLRYGVVLTDTCGRVVSFTEKPAWESVISDMINTGIYVISPRAMALVPDEKKFDFSGDLFPLLLRSGMEIRGVLMNGYWSDIGTPRDYHKTCLDALDGRIKLEPEAVPSQAAPKTCTERAVSPFARRLPCADKARLMRIVSQSLMEAGADFSDGLQLSASDGRVHICPSAESDCIIIDAKADKPESARLLVEKYEGIISRLTEGK